MNPVSVIVRCKNEEKTISSCLKSIRSQSIKPWEIILADNLSTDSTRKIARLYGCKIINIPNPFNHAGSCNLAIKSSKGEIIVITNGHSIPIGRHWLETALTFFKDPKTAGVFGCQHSGNSASVWEKIEKKISGFNARTIRKYHRVSFRSGGLLSTACAAIRKDLWKKYPFNEDISQKLGGGEDTDWAFHFIKDGYTIVQHPNFSVYHSHNDSLVKLTHRLSKYAISYLPIYLKYI